MRPMFLILAAATLPLSACVSGGGGAGGGSTSGWMRLSYACTGGQALQASFSPNGGRASLVVDGQTIAMTRSMSAGGASYHSPAGHVLESGRRSTTLRGPDGGALRSDCVLG